MPEPPGRGNPHLLSQMKTEQVSEGRYDEHGGSVDVAGAAMPMQKIETVDMPRSEALEDFGIPGQGTILHAMLI